MNWQLPNTHPNKTLSEGATENVYHAPGTWQKGSMAAKSYERHEQLEATKRGERKYQGTLMGKRIVTLTQ